MKTHKGLSKRIKTTKGGKFKHVRSNGRHKMLKRSSKQKRKYKRDQNVSSSDKKQIKKMLPY